MQKPIIGIIGSKTQNDKNPFENYHRLIDNYAKRIIEAGGTPIGLLFPDGKFNKDTLDICDGILVQGGSTIYPYHLSTIHYVVEKNIPYLGICLGMQALAGYSWAKNNLFENEINYEKIEKNFKPELETEFLKKIAWHNRLDPFYIEKIDDSKHEVMLAYDSKLLQTYKKQVIKVPSVHSWAVEEQALAENFKITGKSPDNCTEAIESIDKDRWIIGVQFHPELESENLCLFKSFVKEAAKCKVKKKI